MSIILLGVIVVLLIVCIILLIILLNKGDSNKKSKEIRIISSPNIKIERLSFPPKIEEMGHHLLFQSCAKVFDAFKLLEYAKKSEIYLNNYEWHTWQVSLLLSLIQRDQEFFLPKSKNLFHESIVNKPMEKIKIDFENILLKYKDNVNITKSRDELSSEVIWSIKEISIIFYYMLHSKEFKNL